MITLITTAHDTVTSRAGVSMTIISTSCFLFSFRSSDEIAKFKPSPDKTLSGKSTPFLILGYDLNSECPLVPN